MTDTDIQTPNPSASGQGQVPMRCTATAAVVINGRQVLLIKRAKGAFPGPLDIGVWPYRTRRKSLASRRA